MRSPGDATGGGGRVALERAMRVIALAALAWTLWRGTRADTPRRATWALADDATVALLDSTRAGDTLALRLSRAPAPAQRALLAALADAGRAVRWRDAGVPAIAAAVEASRAPDAMPRLDAVAPPGAAVALGVGAALLDSTRAEGGAASLHVAGASGPLQARVGETVARAASPESLAIRRVLVIARAGWEAKFVVAALEEAGWRVDAALDVAPGTVVGQGRALQPDTARHGAVVVLDSAAVGARGAGILRFVRAGGGLVLAGDAAAHPGLAPLRVGRPGSRTPGEAGAVAGAFPRRGLALLAMAPTGDAVVLERRGALVAVAARRIGAGRVMQVGYADSWRWRMEGDDEAPRRHRRWWSDVVAGVAHAPVVALATPATAEEPDPAPRAALVAALGEATAASEPDRAPTRRRRLSDSLLFAAATALLLAEWASRRLRGAR